MAAFQIYDHQLEDLFDYPVTNDVKGLDNALTSITTASGMSRDKIISMAALDINKSTLLHVTASKADTALLKLLIDGLQQPSMPIDGPSAQDIQSAAQIINRGNGRGYTPLHYAAMYGQVNAVKVLLAAGADPSIKNHEGRDAKAEAERLSMFDVANYLIGAALAEAVLG